MAEVTRSLTIAAPRKAVWAVLADFDRIVDWAHDVDHSCLLTDRASEVGAVRRIQQGANTVTETVVDWDEPIRLTYRIDGLPPLFRQVINRWDLAEDEDGTQVCLTVEVVPVRPLAAVVARLAARMVGRVNARMLDDLQAEVEGS
jgi:uncharacterized protein YndB with AHSA1/START domain